MIKQIQRIGKNRFVFTIGLLLLISVAYFNLLYFNGVSFRTAFYDALHTYFWMVFFTFVLQRIHSFYHSRSAISVVHISTITVFSFLVALITHWYAKLIAEFEFDVLLLIQKTFYVRWFILFVILLAIVQQFWIDKHVKEQFQAFNRLLEKERDLVKAEMNNLHQQFQPHFLFNSLNSIYALVKSQPDDAREMLINLSDLLRITIQKGKENFSSIENEINYLELYMSIEKVRFGNRLQVEIIVEDTCKSAMLPSLILQPLVENAIKHGLNGKIGVIKIIINIKCQSTNLFISISNPYDEIEDSQKQGVGFGLKSVEQKLRLIYKRLDLISIQKSDSIYTVNLQIPQNEENYTY